MAKAEAPVAEPVAKPGGQRGLIVILVVALLLISAVCGYALFALRGHGTPSGEASAAPAKQGPELYLPLDPAFVVNFKSDEQQSYLQVGVTLMSHDQAAIDAAKGADPVIRNALVLLFSSQSSADLADVQGKQKLQAKALDAVRKILTDRLGRPGIDALYFTSFVMQ
ncbi:MAG TPA: flagellar basal body-associated FliL family protein [Dyella sp.]|uniref:flagellar basal body-associated FliL family protein n=1 Tax=Dyella sp. TaxID=1869338 RepID=UPI002F94DC9C